MADIAPTSALPSPPTTNTMSPPPPSPAKKQKMVWDADANTRFLLAILKCHSITVNNKAVAEEMGGITPEAVKQHVKALRNKVRAKDGTLPPKSPTKRKRNDEAGEPEASPKAKVVKLEDQDSASD